MIKKKRLIKRYKSKGVRYLPDGFCGGCYTRCGSVGKFIKMGTYLYWGLFSSGLVWFFAFSRAKLRNCHDRRSTIPDLSTSQLYTNFRFPYPRIWQPLVKNREFSKFWNQPEIGLEFRYFRYSGWKMARPPNPFHFSGVAGHFKVCLTFLTNYFRIFNPHNGLVVFRMLLGVYKR